MQARARSGSRLTQSEALELWRAWKTQKDERARDHLVLSLAPMVKYLATRKVRELPAHCELDDLVACGLLALIEAVDRYDPERGATFEQYAWTRVSGEILDELRRQDWAPRALRTVGRKMSRARDQLTARNGRPPTDDELAAAIEIDVSRLRTAREELERGELVSLNAPARGYDDMPIEVGETLEATSVEHDPERALEIGENVGRMREAIGILSERERTMLAMVHVLELSGMEIGRIFGVTESRVSQILANARRKLQAQLDSDSYETITQGAA
jgi:RNA polymerase sigma factor FliA